MNNFVYYAPTKIYFGKGQIEKLPEVISNYGSKVLLCYGGGSIKKNGIYDTVVSLLNVNDILYCELAGVEPNPRINTVRDGAHICKKEQVDVVLAVGGGSVIDCAKMIAAAAVSDDDAWELVKDKSKITSALPVITILTMAGTGSEMNRNSVISNPQTKEKIGGGSDVMLPVASFCDPTYTFTVPPHQIAAGVADIMSHVFEHYFKSIEGAFVQDKIAEGILETCITYGKTAVNEPDNYEARANIMWASSLALCGLCGAGKPGAWSCHPIEHTLSAYYDITHGVGLAILTPVWMRYILNEKTVSKFAEYGRNVWKLNESDDYAVAHQAIHMTEVFFKELGLPSHLREVGIDDSELEAMAKDTIAHSSLQNAYVPLDEADVLAILMEAL